jgi:hypothetical protein
MNATTRWIGFSLVAIGSIILVALALMPFLAPIHPYFIALLSLVSTITWFVTYLIFNAVQTPSSVEADLSGVSDWPVAVRKVSLVMTVTSALIFGMFFLSQLDLVVPFIVIAPFILLFPLSYMAYSAFQRPVRIKRLRSDFELLTAQWDEALYQQSTSFFNYALHIALAMLVTVLGFFVLSVQLMPVAHQPIAQVGLTGDVLRAMGFGFLGGFLFSAYYIYRRYTTSDLLPSVYLYCAITIVLGLVLNYIAFRALQGMRDNPSESLQGLIVGVVDLISFAIGFFPILAVQWLTQVVYKALGRRERRSDLFPLDQLDGISQAQEIRLRDFGIDDAQNLASAELPILLINTPFPVQTVVDWVDQAILMVLLNDSNALDNFRKAHIRTMTDFRDLWEPYVEKQHKLEREFNIAVAAGKDVAVFEKQFAKLKDEQTAVANALNSNAALLNALYISTNFDMNIHYLYNYRKNVELLLPGWASARYNRYLIEAYQCNPNMQRKVFARLWSFVQKYMEANEHITELQKRFPDDDSHGAIVEPTSIEARIGLARLYTHYASISVNGDGDKFKELAKNEYWAAINQIKSVSAQLNETGLISDQIDIQHAA